MYRHSVLILCTHNGLLFVLMILLMLFYGVASVCVFLSVCALFLARALMHFAVHLRMNEAINFSVSPNGTILRHYSTCVSDEQSTILPEFMVLCAYIQQK